MANFRNIDDNNFSLNDKLYPKRYIARNTGDKIEVVMLDSPFGTILPLTYFGNINVDGNIPTSAEDAMVMINTELNISSMAVGSGSGSGGGGSSVSKWRPQPDWWDIKSIFEADPDPNKRFIILLTDSLPTFVITNAIFGNSSAYYKTSDGATYNGNATHTWDISFDKPCAQGYKTRYITVYSSNATVFCNIASPTTNYAKYAYLGNGSIFSSLTFGDSGITNSNYLLETIDFDSTVTTTPTAQVRFQNCYSLSHISMPHGITTSSSDIFSNCWSLISVKLALSLTSLGQNYFNSCPFDSIELHEGLTTVSSSILINCRRLKEIKFPESLIGAMTQISANADSLIRFNIPPLITSIGNMGALRSLLHIEITEGYVMPAFTLGSNTVFPESSARELFNRLGTAPTARTLTFGATLIGRWGADTKAIATNKGYTLA